MPHTLEEKVKVSMLCFMESSSNSKVNNIFVSMLLPTSTGKTNDRLRKRFLKALLKEVDRGTWKKVL